jgi:phenylalanyl-tRNA synthetase beta subunit
MQVRLKAENPDKIKELLRGYGKENIEYNEPHFSLKLEREQIDRNEVSRNILKLTNWHL